MHFNDPPKSSKPQHIRFGGLKMTLEAKIAISRRLISLESSQKQFHVLANLYKNDKKNHKQST